MSTDVCDADCVVVGSGAVGMSFVDVILAESDANVILVDRRPHPGGHRNDAYSFVRLHQPSAFYGVNSTPLGSGIKDDRGPNAGLYELASGDEVRAYFDHVMRLRFLASGRLRYFPMSEYSESGLVMSLLSGKQYSVRGHRRIVDARYVGSCVPSTTPAPFPAAKGIELVPVNDLAKVTCRHDAYVIIGAGKTGADACLWLIDNGVVPSAIVWIRPRDAWFFDRANLQGGVGTVNSFATQVEVVAQASSTDEIFQGFEAAGQLIRIDRHHWPTMFRSATMSKGEVNLLRQITNVVRLGHVIRIDQDAIVLEDGSVPMEANSLYVDCSAPGVPNRPPIPIFDHDKITLQYIMYGGHPTYSAALTAFIELRFDDDARKNEICSPLPISGHLTDVPRNLLTDLKVREQWFSDARIREWMAASRLDPTARPAGGADSDDAEKEAALWRFLGNVGPARESLERIVANES
jgi:hypothetical protein